ncbi:MAG: GTP-binding protein [Cyanobacteria bacterium J06621_8]
MPQVDKYHAEISKFQQNKSPLNNHLTNDGFDFVYFQSDRPFEIEKFEHFLNEKLSNNIFRAKGILWFKGSPAKHIFQMSGPRYGLQDDDWKDNKKNQLVFLGQNLDQELLTSQLENCLIENAV